MSGSAKIKPLFISAIVGAALLFITQFVMYQRYQMSKQKEHEALVSELNNVKDKFYSILNNDITAANTLAIIVREHGVPQNFDSIASQIIANSKYAEVIQLTSGDMITHVYPVRGYEGLIAADTTIQSQPKKVILQQSGLYANPQLLHEGNTGILAKVPIRSHTGLPGFAIVLTTLTTVRQALGIDTKDKELFSYELRKTSTAGDSVNYFRTENKAFSKKEAVSLNIPEGDWALAVSYAAPSSKTNIYLISFFGLLLSVSVAAVVYDKIIASNNLEKLVEAKTKDLIKRNNELEQFNHILSHNVRAPLATLLGLTGFMPHAETEADKAFTMDGIEKSATQLDAVLKDLNIILNTRRATEEPISKISLLEVAEEVHQALTPLIRESKAVIKYDFSAANEIESIPSYIESIFQQLITNSIQYAKPGVAPLIQITSQKLDDNTILTFSDNGMGIDLNKYGKQMFMLYKRFHPEIDGRGLGLFMVRTQIDTLKGNIEVESTVGKGTTFTIFLPNRVA